MKIQSKNARALLKLESESEKGKEEGNFMQ